MPCCPDLTVEMGTLRYEEAEPQFERSPVRMNEQDRYRLQDELKEQLEEPLRLLLDPVRDRKEYVFQMEHFRTELSKAIVNTAFRIALEATQPIDKKIDALTAGVRRLGPG